MLSLHVQGAIDDYSGYIIRNQIQLIEAIQEIENVIKEAATLYNEDITPDVHSRLMDYFQGQVNLIKKLFTVYVEDDIYREPRYIWKDTIDSSEPLFFI